MDSKLLINLLIVFVTIYIFFAIKKHLKNKNRAQLYRQEFPQAWIDILKDNFALYTSLPKDLQRQLHGHINIFLAEKNFVGYQGIDINDTIRVVIAAQACILLLNRKTNYYPHLGNILIYPNAFNHTKQKSHNVTGRLGESWHRGPIVLSWLHSHEGGMNNEDGKNVVMHEFAHQLDQENDVGTGLPILQHNNVKQWSTVLGKDFKALKLKYKLRKRSFLDEYGTTNPAEFFAVITEQFIEQPRKFNKKHPELFKELKKYYQINPIDWI